jgi:hypothetical protein
MANISHPYLLDVECTLGIQDGCVGEAHPYAYALIKAWRREYAYALPDEGLVRRIAGDSPIVEVGAGLGYWSWLLRQAGAEVRATDCRPSAQYFDARGRLCPTPGRRPGRPNDWLDTRPSWTLVEEEAAEAAAAAAPETAALLIVWPPYGEPMASSALRAFRGAVVWYVGEGRGGACADDAFFDELEESWEPDELHALIRFPGMHDWAQRRVRRRR